MTLTVLSVAYPLAPVGEDAVGGAEQVLCSLDRALVEVGHRSVVVAPGGSRVAGTLVPIQPETGPLDEAARRRAQGATRAAIAEARRRFRPDVVHLHGIDFPAYCPVDGPTLVSLHLPLDWYPAEAFRPRAGLFLHPVSHSQASTAPAGGGLLPPIRNGVAADRFGGPFAKRSFVLNLSRICPEKGTHLAIEAAKRADVALLIGGEVFAYEVHRRYFDEEVAPRLDARRRFLGPVGWSRKRRLLAAARCLLVPSLARETSSLVAMEALASGTPVVAFPNGALPEIVDHGVTGFLVDGVAAMADAIGRVGGLDRAACQAAARSRFSRDRMVAETFELYDRIASGRMERAA